MPLAEVVLDFFDRLKSVSRGYASFDYQFERFEPRRPGAARRADQRRRSMRCRSSCIGTNAQKRGRELVEQNARTDSAADVRSCDSGGDRQPDHRPQTVKALRKNVTAKCYGGDVSRKRKLLEKQKAGKHRMKQVGSVEIPQEAFLAVLRADK